MRVSLPEARRLRALEMAGENFGRQGIATETASVLAQAKAFEDFLRAGTTTVQAKKKARKRAR
jgi:hypothetical protein